MRASRRITTSGALDRGERARPRRGEARFAILASRSRHVNVRSSLSYRSYRSHREYRSLPLRYAGGAISLAASMALASSTLGCAKLGKKGAPDASAEAGATAHTTTAATATAPPSSTVIAPPDPLGADRATFDAAKKTLAEVQALVAKNVVKDPAKSDDSDAKTKCESLDAMLPKLEPHATDGDVQGFLESTKKVCGFDVPLLTATDALDSLRNHPSQASRRLMCNIAQKEIGKARATKPSNGRVHAADERWRRTCS